MSVKLADTLAPMSDFPVAEAQDVSIDIGGTSKDLQTAYEDGDLGGGDTIQVSTMPLASSENEGQIVEFVGASGTYQNGYFYKCVSDGESPATYSWVQQNVQPSNAEASQVSYDNTTSGLTADDVQEAIDEVVAGLGTASGKDYTDTVRPNSHDLVESVAVYSAINNALNTIYTPRGDLSCADLTSALLIEANVGNVYTMSDSGLTSALFINGAGITISANDNVGIIKAGQDTILFNYMGSAFDLHDYQKKDLTTAIEGQTTVEGALGLLEYKSSIFNGTVAEYEALSQAEQKKYSHIGSEEIDDGDTGWLNVGNQGCKYRVRNGFCTIVVKINSTVAFDHNGNAALNGTLPSTASPSFALQAPVYMYGYSGPDDDWIRNHVALNITTNGELSLTGGIVDASINEAKAVITYPVG